MCDLQSTIEEMRLQDSDFQVQMKEQCEDYKELLSEKMARDMEIAAYRSAASDVEKLSVEALISAEVSVNHGGKLQQCFVLHCNEV